MESGRQEGASPLRARDSRVSSVHEVVVTRFNVVVPICGMTLRRPVRVDDHYLVTCLFCNGTEERLNTEDRF